MARRIIFCLSVFIVCANLHAFQIEPVVATINSTPIHSGEFLYAFNKNRTPDQPIHADSLLTYLNQYINFRLKVLAAQQAGIDTTATFIKEFEGYTAEIKKPYLQGANLVDDLIEEGYQRLQEEVRASHIPIRIPQNASPKDTLSAYQTIAQLKERADSGEDFAELAKKNSHDGSSQAGGDLGYFTGFTMVYPFESASYNTPTGSISGIIRSQFGYHLVKVTDPAMGYHP